MEARLIRPRPTKGDFRDADPVHGTTGRLPLRSGDPLRVRQLPAAARRQRGRRVLSRQLRAGDIVTIPDFEQRIEENRAVETLHQFVLETAPPATIRFVHGTPNLLWKDDPTTEFLNVSNYVTTRGGTQGTQGQQFPRSGTRFNDNAHQDPDSFKVEVVDRSRRGARWTCSCRRSSRSTTPRAP